MKDELVEVFNRIDSIIGDAEGVSLDVYLKKGGYSVAEAYAQIARYISEAHRAGQLDCQQNGDVTNHTHFKEAVEKIIGADETNLGDRVPVEFVAAAVRNGLRAEQRKRLEG